MNQNKILLTVLAALAATLIVAVPALAQKVDNPGNLAITSNDGALNVNSQAFTFDTITFNGSITGTGAVTIPAANIVFPDQFTSASGFTFRIHISANSNATGTLNPITGAATLNASLKVSITSQGSAPPGFNQSCNINPVNIALSTAKSGGVPYNASTGTLTVADAGFNVPGASSCGSFFTENYNSDINSALGGLPTTNTSVVIAGTTSPVIHKAVAAALSASPNSGLAPLDVTLDASASHVAATPASYRWDFNGDGTTDQTTSTPTTSHTYSAGSFTAKVTVVDRDGDSDTASTPISVTPRTPDVTIVKSHTGDFVASSDGTYTLAVSNVGTLDTTGTTTVTDPLPASETFESASGDGWSCSNTGQTVTCDHADPIAAGSAASPITLQVLVTGDAIPSVANTASVSTPGDTHHANDSSTDTANVITPEPDLAIVKTHEGAYFLRSGPANPRGTYDLNVRNVGNQPTSGLITVTDPLPLGLSFHAAFGDGWDCGAADNTVTCTTNAIVAGSSSAPTIRIVTDVAPDAPDTITNTATVQTDGDTNAANNAGSDTVTTRPFGVDLSIVKTHTGSFVRGETGTYRIAVTNKGTEGTLGPVTVTDPLPAGLGYISAAGVDWSCGFDSGTVTCTRPDQLDAGQSAPAIALRVSVDETAADGVTNTASVSEPETDLNPADNQTSDPTNVRGLEPDLTIVKSHTGSFTAGQFAVYRLAVSNVGSDPTFDTITVHDTLPASLAFDSAAGTGWSCGAVGQDVTCTRTDALAPGGSEPEIALRVVPDEQALPSVSNTASVSTAGDPNSANDADTDTATVVNPPAKTGIISQITGTATYAGHHGPATFTITLKRRLFGQYSGSITYQDPAGAKKVIGTVNGTTQVTRFGLNGAQGDAVVVFGGGRIHWTVDDRDPFNLGPDVFSISDPKRGYTFSGPITGGDIKVT